MHPKLITIGNFFIPTYGVLVALAFLTALWIAARLGRRSGLNPDSVINLGVYCALAGLAGAKVFLILVNWRYYGSHIGEIFSLSTLQSGGVFYGGLIAALLVAVWYMRRKGLPGLKTADVFAPGIALGHAIGKLGCLSAGCGWGVKSHLPWAVTFTNPDAHRLVGVPLNVPLQPTQLYAVAAETIIFLILYWRFAKAHRDGVIIGLYLVLYSSARFLIDFVRYYEQPNPFGGPFTVTQWIALGMLALGLWLVLRRRQPSSTG